MKSTSLSMLAIAGAIFALAPCAIAQDNFADNVVSYSNLNASAPYSNPNAALGQPTTLDYDGYSTYHRSMVNTAYNTAPGGSNLLAALDSTGLGTLTVSFNTPIVHDPSNWYGMDFIVFGDQGFIGGPGYADDATEMANYFISDGTTYSTLPTVSVSQDGVTFYTMPSPLTPNGNTLFPENPYAWDSQTHAWSSDTLDFTKPVDPALTDTNFTGKSVADAIAMYGGSAGGTAFTLAGTPFVNDPKGISYIRFTGAGGVVDAVSRVSAAPEPSPLLIVAAGGLAVACLFWRRRRQA